MPKPFDLILKPLRAALLRLGARPASQNSQDLALLQELDGVLFNTRELLLRLAESNATTGWTKWDTETMQSIHAAHLKVLNAINPKPTERPRATSGWAK